MKITVKTGVTGPKHDPYGTTTVIVATANHRVTHYSCGLGQIVVDVDGVEVISSLSGDDDAVADYAAQVFEKHAGISLQAAIEKYESSSDEDSWGMKESRYV
jgi:hypothetical protein